MLLCKLYYEYNVYDSTGITGCKLFCDIQVSRVRIDLAKVNNQSQYYGIPYIVNNESRRVTGIMGLGNIQLT